VVLRELARGGEGLEPDEVRPPGALEQPAGEVRDVRPVDAAVGPRSSAMRSCQAANTASVVSVSTKNARRAGKAGNRWATNSS
jgi:hypothetical protein